MRDPARQRGARADLADLRWRAGATARPDAAVAGLGELGRDHALGVDPVPAGQVMAVVGAAGHQQVPERPRGHGELGAGALLNDPPAVEDGHQRGPLDRGQPVGDEDAGPGREQSVRRGHHAALRERVHARGGLVEHDHAHVTHQQAGEGDELLLPRRERRAAGTEQGVQAVRQTGDPAVQTQLHHRRLDRAPRDVGEEGDVLGEGAREDLRTLRDHTDGTPKALKIQVPDVGAAQEHRASWRLHRARDERGQRRLAGAGATDQRDGLARGDLQVDALQRERSLGVGEVEVAQLQVERPLGKRTPALRLGRDSEHLPQPDDSAEAGLQVRQVVGHHRDLADERRGDQEEGHQLGDREVAAGGERHPGDRNARQQSMEQDAGAPDQAALDVDDRLELRVYVGGEPSHASQDVRLAEAGAQVVATGDPLLEHGGVVGPRHLLDHLAARDLTEQRPDGEPRDAREHREEDEGRATR